MNNVSFEDFISIVKKYNSEEVSIVIKAYEFAKKFHEGQKRESGEDYITHPLNVAYILASMYADKDTLCAGLLHDTLEDTTATKEDIERLFNKDVAELVDGVTKFNKSDFSTKEEQENANTRKLVTGINIDARIIIIKLADRLHNMRTLQYKNKDKQIENSIETMEIYAPYAGKLGCYKFKRELEDLSLKFLIPEEFDNLTNDRNIIITNNEPLLLNMASNISGALSNSNIQNNVTTKYKNIYSIYKRKQEGQKIENIHDMLALNVLVDTRDECYRALGEVHGLYNPYTSKFKDYICCPKPNMYQSLHTSLFSGDNFVQAQIRTNMMNIIATYGLMAYWYFYKGDASKIMQEDLNTKFPFLQSLSAIDSMSEDDSQYLINLKSEVFSDSVFIYNITGDQIELPKGANIIDYAYKLGPEIGNNMVGAIVNNEKVPFDYILNNRDRVKIEINKNGYHSREGWEEKAHTCCAKQLIRKYNK